MQRSAIGIGMVFGMMAAGLVHAEQTLESVENEVAALWTKIDAFSAKTTTDATVPMGPMNMKSHATGTLECLKQGNNQFRLECLTRSTRSFLCPGLCGVTEQKVLSVFDGKELFNEMEMMGKRQAFKMSRESATNRCQRQVHVRVASGKRRSRVAARCNRGWQGGICD